jgi:hypothetical protein
MTWTTLKKEAEIFSEMLAPIYTTLQAEAPHQHSCENLRPRGFSLFHRAFQFTIYNGPTNALACNKTLSQMSHTKTFKITPTCFDHQIIIIRELFDPG